MAVKIAHAMGAEVTVLSQTLNKRDDGLQFGATTTMLQTTLKHSRNLPEPLI
ncbi:D-arabinose 1-dehydrogenase-like Zn-dependent alcohol dehydrogenase [Neobacillus sp. B4I6]